MKARIFKPNTVSDLCKIERNWENEARNYSYLKKKEIPAGCEEIFAKEEYLKTLDEYYDGAQIKQVMPIPENMAVILVEWNSDEEAVCCDSRDTNWPYGLAFTMTKTGADICPIDLVDGKLNVEAQLVTRHKCGKCGREMKILLKPGQEGVDAKYHCEDCGRTIWLDNDGTEFEVEPEETEHE